MNAPQFLTPPTQEDCVVLTTVPSTPTLVKPPDQLKQVGDRDTCVDDTHIARKALDLESLLEGPTDFSLPYTQETMQEDDVDVEQQNDLLPPDDNVATLPIHS